MDSSSIEHEVDIEDKQASLPKSEESGLGRRQLFAMLYKNYLLKRRNSCQTCCEIFTPVFFMLLLVFGWVLSLPFVENVPAANYATNNTLIEDMWGAVSSGLVPIDTRVNDTSCTPLPLLTGYKFCNDSFDLSGLSDLISYSGPFPIPPFDIYVGLHNIIQVYLENSTSIEAERINTLTSGQLANLIFLGGLAFAPNTTEVHELVGALGRTHVFFNQTFDNIYETEDVAVRKALQTKSVANRTWAVISFRTLNLTTGEVDYTIRMNYSSLPSTNTLANRYVLGLNTIYKQYYFSGFLTLQNMIQTYILNSANNTNTDDDNTTFLDFVNSSSTANFVAIPFPIPAYNGNTYYTAVGPIVGLMMCMSVLYPFSRLTKSIVEEKELRLKETMKMMGLKDWVFAASWFITYFVIFTLIALIMALVLAPGVLQNTNFSLLFIFFFLFVCTQITFAFFISCFFSHAKLAGIVGPIILFATVMPRYAFFTSENSSDISKKTWASLLSPTAFAFAADLLMQYEGANIGMNWEHIYDDPFSFANSLAMMFVDFWLYGLLAWYFEHVLPNQYGTHLRPWFLFTRSYWFGNVSATDPALLAEKSRVYSDELVGAHIEPVGLEFKAKKSIQIRAMRKVFQEGYGKSKKVTRAVDGIDLDMYEGQITALLGHNGAGKTTLISILTGLFPPTSGDCLIRGLSLTQQMPEIRKSLGICPQFNVLFDTLTVYEHLQLYATLKGVPKKDVHSAVMSKIEEVGLSDKKDIFSSALSGGMKRKLCVAMALIGGSRVVFLDEPTSGMDPYSRRATWELLRRSTPNRCIILTTHFMDEADLLGDRIAIMSEGKLRCLGSSLFLKAKYGVGYHLTMVKDGACDEKAVVAMVQRHVPTAHILNISGGEIAMQLPLNTVSQFAGLFGELEERRTDMGIGGYGISMTTLEEVFMRLAGNLELEMKGNPHSPIHPAKHARHSATPQIGVALSDGDADAGHDSDFVVADVVADADGGGGGGGGGSAASGDGDAGTEMAPIPSGERARSPSTDETEAVNLHLDPAYMAANSAKRDFSMTRQFVELVRKRYICAIRDLKGRFFEVILPVVVIALIMIILKLNVNPAGPSITLDFNLYGDTSTSRARQAGVQGGVCEFPASESFLAAQPTVFDFFNATQGVKVRSEHAPNSWNMSSYLLDTYSDHGGVDRYGALVINDTLFIPANITFNGTNYYQDLLVPNEISFLHNSTFFHALPVLVATYTNAQLKALLASNNRDPSNASYTVSNHPLPLTDQENLQIQTFLTLFAALFVLIPFCYLPASFVIFLVKERSSTAKHLQLVSGVNATLYWLASYVWDLLNFLIVIACCMAVFKSFSNNELVGSSTKASATFVLIWFYAIAVLPLSYCFSFAFNTHTSAQVGIAGAHFVLGFVLVIGNFILDSVESTAPSNKWLKHFYRFSPAFNLGEGLINIASIDLLALFDPQGKVAGAFDWEITGRSLTYLSTTALGFFLFTLVLEYQIFSGIFEKISQAVGRLNQDYVDLVTNFDPIRDVDPAEDADVATERNRVVKEAKGDDDVVLIKHLRKVYPAIGGKKPTVAVQNLCLGIPRGQCFGFLGINGAGKTSTLKCLTGDEKFTAGDAFVLNHSVRMQLREVRQTMGYCPQFDPLLDDMTGREHLQMYARFRGIPEAHVPNVVTKLLKKLGLTKYADKTSGSYSGGNKRKLALALALVGEPSVVFLDEPSTGMDPVARRFMWNVIASVTANKSVILTTHSMEECEALCNRIGIMVSGKLRCLGGIQHLKSRFGHGYHMEINTTERMVAQVKEFVERTFEGATLEEFHAGRLKYRLPKQSLSLSAIFGAIEREKEGLEIEDYSVSQSTLEQIFLLMAAQGD